MTSLIIFLFFISCSSIKKKDGFKPFDIASKRSFIYTDMTGSYFLNREAKKSQSKVVTRRKLFFKKQEKNYLEKTISISKIVQFNGNKPGIIPLISQHEIWFDKNKFFSQISIDLKEKKAKVDLISPEKKWNGQQTFDLPKSNVYCFFTQLPECLKSYGILHLLKNKENSIIPIALIWDIYPFHQEQFSNIKDNLVELAQIKRDDNRDNKILRVNLELENQIIIYHFTKRDKLEGMFWISQGMSVKAIN